MKCEELAWGGLCRPGREAQSTPATVRFLRSNVWPHNGTPGRAGGASPLQQARRTPWQLGPLPDVMGLVFSAAWR